MWGSFPLYNDYGRKGTLFETNIAGWKMYPDWVDVFPIEHGDFPASHVSFKEYCITEEKMNRLNRFFFSILSWVGWDTWLQWNPHLPSFRSPYGRSNRYLIWLGPGSQRFQIYRELEDEGFNDPPSVYFIDFFGGAIGIHVGRFGIRNFQIFQSFPK